MTSTSNEIYETLNNFLILRQNLGLHPKDNVKLKLIANDDIIDIEIKIKNLFHLMGIDVLYQNIIRKSNNLNKTYITILRDLKNIPKNNIKNHMKLKIDKLKVDHNKKEFIQRKILNFPTMFNRLLNCELYLHNRFQLGKIPGDKSMEYYNKNIRKTKYKKWTHDRIILNKKSKYSTLYELKSFVVDISRINIIHTNKKMKEISIVNGKSYILKVYSKKHNDYINYDKDLHIKKQNNINMVEKEEKMLTSDTLCDIISM